MNISSPIIHLYASLLFRMLSLFDICTVYSPKKNSPEVKGQGPPCHLLRPDFHKTRTCNPKSTSYIKQIRHFATNANTSHMMILYVEGNGAKTPIFHARTHKHAHEQFMDLRVHTLHACHSCFKIFLKSGE